MGLQGSLREFAAWEIVQLLSSQKKTGRLHLRNAHEQISFYFLDGRFAGAREPGLSSNDPLMRFLRRVRWLSDEQLRGIETLHNESQRDLLDLLLNGRYIDSEELNGIYERMTLDLLWRLLRWEDGEYSFTTVVPPETPLRISLSADSLLMEAARRVDEFRRLSTELPEGHKILGMRELPDPDAVLPDEEKELFGLVDGRRTLAEIVSQSPLTDYEAMEGLSHLLENRWIEVVGARELGAEPTTAPEAPPAASRFRETAMVGAYALTVFALLFVTAPMRQPPDRGPGHPSADTYERARWLDVEMALDVYRAEHGEYPERLQELTATEWLRAPQLKFSGGELQYLRSADKQSYRLELADTK